MSVDQAKTTTPATTLMRATAFPTPVLRPAAPFLGFADSLAPAEEEDDEPDAEGWAWLVPFVGLTLDGAAEDAEVAGAVALGVAALEEDAALLSAELADAAEDDASEAEDEAEAMLEAPEAEDEALLPLHLSCWRARAPWMPWGHVLVRHVVAEPMNEELGQRHAKSSTEEQPASEAALVRQSISHWGVFGGKFWATTTEAMAKTLRKENLILKD